MKKITLILGALILSGTFALAQNPQGQGGRPQMDESMMQEMQDRMDPEKSATRQADKLKEQLGLNDEQYKQVHKIYKAEAQARINSMQNAMGGGMMGGGMPGGGMMGGGMPGGGMMGGGMPGGGRGGFGGGDGASMGQGGQRSGGMSSMMQDDEKTIEKRNKKMAKILTPEQYDKFIAIQEQELMEQQKRAEEMQQRMRERMGRNTN